MINYIKEFLRDPITGFRRRHTLLKIFNLFLNQFCLRILKSSYVIGYPIHLSIESTNFCNLKCPMCSTNRSFSTRKKGKINFENFKKIVDEIGRYLYVLGPFNGGEPLLHEEIFDMISYAQKKNISTIISTNGILINEDIAKKIIDSGLEKLLISIDAATERTYNKLRQGGNFTTLIENIKLLVQKKGEKASKTPYIIIQMIITKYNEYEINDFKKLAKELEVDRYILSNFWEQSLGNSQEEIETSNLYPIQKKFKNLQDRDLNVKDTCRWAWSGSVINWNGSVVPCCFDYNETYVIGNIYIDSFRKLWNNTKYCTLRNEIKKGRKNILLCKKCPYGI